MVSSGYYRKKKKKKSYAVFGSYGKKVLPLTQIQKKPKYVPPRQYDAGGADEDEHFSGLINDETGGYIQETIKEINRKAREEAERQNKDPEKIKQWGKEQMSGKVMSQFQVWANQHGYDTSKSFWQNIKAGMQTPAQMKAALAAMPAAAQKYFFTSQLPATTFGFTAQDAAKWLPDAMMMHFGGPIIGKALGYIAPKLGRLASRLLPSTIRGGRRGLFNLGGLRPSGVYVRRPRKPFNPKSYKVLTKRDLNRELNLIRRMTKYERNLRTPGRYPKKPAPRPFKIPQQRYRQTKDFMSRNPNWTNTYRKVPPKLPRQSWEMKSAGMKRPQRNAYASKTRPDYEASLKQRMSPDKGVSKSRRKPNLQSGRNAIGRSVPRKVNLALRRSPIKKTTAKNTTKSPVKK